MRDIKVGDFVRTDSGEIFKVIDVEKGSVKIKSNYKEWIGLCCISKHSPNIIELIEVGDYVNGEIVVEVYKITFNGILEIEVGELSKTLRNKNIETIVTKEQFKSVSYEVR